MAALLAQVFLQQVEQRVLVQVQVGMAVRLTLAALLVVLEHQFILAVVVVALVMERQERQVVRVGYMVAVAVEAGLLQARWVVLVRLALLLLPTPH
jgi:hypothetical protein